LQQSLPVIYCEITGKVVFTVNLGCNKLL